MAQIFSQSTLPPLFQKVDDLFSAERQHTSISRKSYRNTSESPSPVSDSRNMHFRANIREEREEYRKYQEHGEFRESLPPFSSILSGINQPNVYTISECNSRHSTLNFKPFTSDSRYLTLATEGRERSHSSTHIGKIQSDTQIFPSDYRFANTTNLKISPPPPLRPSFATTQGPQSPIHDIRQIRIKNHSTQAPYLVRNWSPNSHSSHLEFTGKANPISVKSDTEHTPSQRHISETMRLEVVESQDNSTQVTSSTSPTESKDSTTRNSLGPKIWAGNKFLPQFTHEAYVSGEGTCYFYDDGTHCKSVIEGESVNKNWGVTKTGKPRKRLAIACMTCREKKIKCDPDFPQCEQCKKFGRTCRFKNAPRGSQSTAGSPPQVETEEHIITKGSTPLLDDEPVREKQGNTQPILHYQTAQYVNPNAEMRCRKRQKNCHPEFTPIVSETSPRTSVWDTSTSAANFVAKVTDPTVKSNIIRPWHTNPYVLYPEIVTDLLSTFFIKVPETIHCIFAQGIFQKWALTPEDKSLDEYTTLYAILSLASLFSQKPEYRALGEYYAPICRNGCENRPFNLQLVQSRLILALYYFAGNKVELTSDLCGSAMRTATALKLNLELEKSDDAHLKVFPFGLDRTGYAESRRRTFWSIYIVDKFDGFCSGKLGVFVPKDIFLRLPCDTAKYESQAEVHAPFFEYPAQCAANPIYKIGCLGYLINIATIWEDVLAEIYRRSQRNLPSSPKNFSSFYEETVRCMAVWDKSLPDRYRISAENIQRAAQNRSLGIMILMHSVYHNTGMKLNRYIPRLVLSYPPINRYVATANQHAEALLMVMDTLYATIRSNKSPTPNHDRVVPICSSPFVGHCIVSAVDILTARVPKSSVPSRIKSFESSMMVLSDLSTFWQSSEEQYNLVHQRSLELSQCFSGRHNSSLKVVGSRPDDSTYVFHEPLEQMFPRDSDCIYS